MLVDGPRLTAHCTVCSSNKETQDSNRPVTPTADDDDDDVAAAADARFRERDEEPMVASSKEPRKPRADAASKVSVSKTTVSKETYKLLEGQDCF